jgi:dipeptidyl aminopeptidase/acylaminoacyl peptidase
VRSGGVAVVSVDTDTVRAVEMLPFDATRSWSTPEFTADGREVHVVADWSEVWGLDTETLETWVFHDASDFAMDPAGVAGGASLAWNRPEMSWTTSRIQPHVARDGVSVQQPRRDRVGRLAGWIDDESGWWNVVVMRDDGTTVRIKEPREHAGPVWGPGQRTWCPSPDGTMVALARNDDGFGSLWVRDINGNDAWQVARGIHGCLSWEGNVLAAVRSGARTPQQLVAYDVSDLDSPARAILCTPADARWTTEHDADLVEPTTQTARVADGTNVPFRAYAPLSPNGGLIVWVHGGPIDQWQVTFRPRLTTWISRGWTVAVPDHRGTTGHGRAFREALDGCWGDIDVTDTLAVVHEMRARGFTPETTVMMGGSAGGLTALGVAAREPDSVAGVVVSYPVVDLAEMLRHDDPFEGHYMPTLLGASDPNDAHLAMRSPLAGAASLARVPILAFHGDNDHSVPLVHSERLRDAVASAGGDVDLVVFAGEGHGFKLRESLVREFEMTEEFLDGVLSRRRG